MSTSSTQNINPKRILVLKRFLILFSLIVCVSSKCSKGCLRCNDQDECLYCDVIEGYYLNSYKNCVLNKIERCAVMSQEGLCIQCEDFSYLDSLKNICIEVPLINKIDKCLTYSDLFTCVKCEQFYYVSNNTCKEVPKNIVNCLNFKIDNYEICLECSKGYVLNHDGSECLPIINIDNCLGYSIQTCDECNPGWTSNESSYLMPFNTMTNPIALNTFNKFLSNSK